MLKTICKGIQLELLTVELPKKKKRAKITLMHPTAVNAY